MDSNLTIITIVYIVILIVPGVFFKRFYFQGAFNRQFQSGQFADRFVTSIFWGIVTQSVFFYAFINTVDVEFESLYELLVQTHENFSNNKVPSLQKEAISGILLYLLGSVVFAMILGFLLFRIVRVTKLDLKTKVLRFSNKWHYYFSGEILKTNDFRGKLPKDKLVIGALVDVLVKYGEGDNRLFSGNLAQYTINNEGNLETLYLIGARRYSDSKGNPTKSPKVIPGDCFVVSYQNVLNLNLNYILIQKDVNKVKKIVKDGFSFIFQLLIFTLLGFALILPWYSPTSFGMKLLAIILFIVSWFFIAILITNFLNPKKQFGIKGSIFILLIFITFLTLGFQSLGFQWIERAFYFISHIF